MELLKFAYFIQQVTTAKDNSNNSNTKLDPESIEKIVKRLTNTRPKTGVPDSRRTVNDSDLKGNSLVRSHAWNGY